MARPQPIVIPGSQNISERKRADPMPAIKLFEIIASMVGANKDREQQQLGNVEVLKSLNLPQFKSGMESTPVESPTGGMVNEPGAIIPPQLDINKLAGVDKNGMEQFVKMFGPQKYEAANKTLYNPTNPTEQMPIGPQDSTSEGDHYTVKNIKDPSQIKSIRLKSGETIPAGWEIAQTQRADSFKDQYVGPSLENDGKDIWTEFDSQGRGKTVLRPSAGNAMPKNMGRTPVTAMSQANYLKHAQDRITRMGEDYRPEYVGWLKNQNLFGLSINEFKKRTSELPPEQVRFYRNLWDMNDAMIRKSEGAVVPEAMMIRLEKFMNDIKEKPENFEVQFEDLSNSVRQDMLNLHGSLSGQYKSPFEKRNEDFWMENKPILKHGSKATSNDDMSVFWK
jgi:hypothetical protein